MHKNWKITIWKLALIADFSQMINAHKIPRDNDFVDRFPSSDLQPKIGECNWNQK